MKIYLVHCHHDGCSDSSVELVTTSLDHALAHARAESQASPRHGYDVQEWRDSDPTSAKRVQYFPSHRGEASPAVDVCGWVRNYIGGIVTARVQDGESLPAWLAHHVGVAASLASDIYGDSPFLARLVDAEARPRGAK